MILEKYDAKLWDGLKWLSVEKIVGFCENGNEFLGQWQIC